jgi:hypothetical protein
MWDFTALFFYKEKRFVIKHYNNPLIFYEKLIMFFRTLFHTKLNLKQIV